MQTVARLLSTSMKIRSVLTDLLQDVQEGGEPPVESSKAKRKVSSFQGLLYHNHTKRLKNYFPRSIRFYFDKDFVPAQEPEREWGIVAGEDRLTNAVQTGLIKSFQKD